MMSCWCWITWALLKFWGEGLKHWALHQPSVTNKLCHAAEGEPSVRTVQEFAHSAALIHFKTQARHFKGQDLPHCGGKFFHVWFRVVRAGQLSHQKKWNKSSHSETQRSAMEEQGASLGRCGYSYDTLALINHTGGLRWSVKCCLIQHNLKWACLRSCMT